MIRHIYVPNVDDLLFWGDVPFLLWGPPFMTGDGPKMVHFGPKMANYGRLVNVPKWSKRDQNVQPFGTPLGPSGPLWTILDKNDFWPKIDKVGFERGAP